MTDHHHPHHHHHHHTAKTSVRIAIFLTAGMFIIELVGGLWSNSLALLADAGHMATDLAALLLSFMGFLWAERKPDRKRTFGYTRAEIVIGFANGILLWVLAGFICVEAIHRFINPEPVKAGSMLIVAIAGLVVNLFSAAILFRSSHQNLNAKAAFLHVLGDAIGSVGAITAGVIILTTGWMLADPVISMLISVLILISSFHLIRDSVHILLEGNPDETLTRELKSDLGTIKGVVSVHDMHIWTLGSGINNLSCHLVVSESGNPYEILKQAHEIVKPVENIHHATFQIESDSFSDCFQCEPSDDKN